MGCNDEQPDSGTRRYPACQKHQQHRRPLRLSGKDLHPRLHRPVPQPADDGRCRAVPAVFWYGLAQLGRPPGCLVEPAGAQVLHLRRHLLATGFHPAVGPADHLRLWPVLHYRVRRPGLVRLYLPAKRLDLDLHVVRKSHRRRPQPTHQARQGADERQQIPAQIQQAHDVAADRLRHRHDLCRLLLAYP
ncbi:hypothetical protein D3C84_802180 [compost metagenome]